MPERCPVCGDEPVDRFRWIPPYSVCQCGGCGLLFADPMPTDEQLDEFYQGFLYRKPNPQQLEVLIEQKQQELGRLFGVSAAEEAAGRTLLDFGGGTGVTYEAAKRLGFDTHYYEIDQQAVDFVSEEFDLPADRTYTRPEQLDGKTFDCVIADNVVEHDPRPFEFLERLYACLAPGGELVIKTPNARNTELWFYPAISVGRRDGYASRSWRYGTLADGFRTWARRRWNCDPPRHVFSFSGASLQRLAEQVGVDEHKVEHYVYSLWEYSLTQWASQEMSLIRGWVRKPLHLPGMLLEWPMKLLHVCLRRCGLLSPTGVTLRVRRDQPST